MVLRRLRTVWDCESLRPAYDTAPEPLRRDLNSADEQLRSKDASMDDVVAAMDLARDAVRSMVAKFSGKFHRDEDWDLDDTDDGDENQEDEEYDEEDEKEREKDFEYSRYKCAAMLPVLAKLVEEVWPPLKKKIMSNEPRDADRE